jgi:hypothetical protein
MNLPYTYELLAAADEQGHGFIKVRDVETDHEVRLMAEAGLVEATFNDGHEGSFTSITRVTATGQTFLRAFKDRTIPAAANLGKSSHAVLAAKWKANLDLGLTPFGTAA